MTLKSNVGYLQQVTYGPRQANLVLIAYASSEGSGEPVHPRSGCTGSPGPVSQVSQVEPSDRKPDPWPLWMAGHAQLKFVMTECSKTQFRLTGLICNTDIKRLTCSNILKPFYAST